MSFENVISEFDRAKKALKSAQILQEEGMAEDAVSRSYYAVMHAARAALLANDTIAESHAAVRRLFGAVLVRPGLIEKEWAAILAREQDQCIVADYNVQIAWELETSASLVEDARAFVRRVQDYLASVGISVE